MFNLETHVLATPTFDIHRTRQLVKYFSILTLILLSAHQNVTIINYNLNTEILCLQVNINTAYCFLHTMRKKTCQLSFG